MLPGVVVKPDMTGAPLKVRAAIPSSRRCPGEPLSGQEAWVEVQEQRDGGAPWLRDRLSLVSTGNGLTAKRLCTAINSSITAQAEVSRCRRPLPKPWRTTRVLGVLLIARLAGPNHKPPPSPQNPAPQSPGAKAICARPSSALIGCLAGR